MKIVFLDRETFPTEVNFPQPSFPHELAEHAYSKPEEVEDRISEADIIITNKVVLNSTNLPSAKNLKFIALTATGSNNIDLDYCRKNNVQVSNIRDYGTQSVVEHVLALIFTLRRDLLAYNDMIRAGAWQESRQFVLFSRPVVDIKGDVLAIVGKGNLGQTLAKYATALGMEVIFAERPNISDATQVREGYVEFYEALSKCDILSLHCPLSEDNARMMGAKEFARMKKTCLLINTARGGLIDEQALADALTNGEIAGAGIDVVDGEPPPATNPLLKLTDKSNLLITPHTAWISRAALDNAIQQNLENLEAFVAGSPIRLLT
ncbi:MAG: D-2-hydroxyacid dehydrogenase [Candidatus Portiera sp.]|nr:D-2-hydroxyacid dehydrogenase [Portiera sp.]